MTETPAERYARELALADATGCGSPDPAPAEVHYLAAIAAAEEAFGTHDERAVTALWALLHLYWCCLGSPPRLEPALRALLAVQEGRLGLEHGALAPLLRR